MRGMGQLMILGSCVIYMKNSRKIYRVVFEQAEKNMILKIYEWFEKKKNIRKKDFVLLNEEP